MKKVVLIGDSIRLGYEKFVKDSLEGVAEVFSPDENCRFTLYLMRYIHEYIKDGVLPADADIVIGVPDSSLSAAQGYAEASGLPYEMGLIKSTYVGRTFILPTQSLREKGVKMKLSPVKTIVKGKRVVLVDDSIVRGTTSLKIVKMLREAGASEVHVRIASAPLKYTCYYGT